MEMPEWWDERRLGLLIHASLASVPSWAPVGGRADRYRAHLGQATPGDDPDDEPLVEVLAYHRDRWDHIERFDDFVPLLRFNDFDAEAWARLAIDAGAGYAAVVARDRDGWVWWDAPTTTRTMVTNGPHRNVVADFAVACERNELPLGVRYAALGTDRTDPAEAAQLARHDVVDLVERLGIEFVRLTDDDRHARTARLVEGDRTVRVVERIPPDEILDEPWELHRDLGPGLGHNRTERAEHQLTADAIVALLTEVVAKGGHLLLSVGATADGVVPDVQASILRGVGDWIRAHDDLVNRGRPWSSWGDADSRFIDVDGVVHVVDVGGRGHFAHLTSQRCRVESITIDGLEMPFHQDETGVHLDAHRPVLRTRRDADDVDVDVYRVTIAPVDRPATLFGDADDEPRRPIELAPLLRGVAAGDIVQLGDGSYVGPATIPEGVTIRGLGGARTVIHPGPSALLVAAGARIEHLCVRDAPDADRPSMTVVGAAALVLGCHIDGVVSIEADDVTIRATRVGGVQSAGVDRASISRCQLTARTGGAGIHVRGGSGHRITSCEIAGHRCAIHLTDAAESLVSGNNLTAQRCAVRLERTEGAQVHGNFISHTMRGIDVDGGAHASVQGNAVCDGDSGCIVEWGAAACSITGNTWERCRIGVLAWESPDVTVHSNESIDLHEPDAAFTSGP